MRHIAVLSPDVADQIAAGEVVERPASVVKELIENSLDALATMVEITVEDGGRTLIRVADDGTGMTRDDAVLSIARHATSKIVNAEQLVGVSSFGFRGEALAAIASVSHLTLETAVEDGSGTRVLVDGGTLAETGEIARRRGTTVTISGLFHNVPARRKFLKGARSEWRAVMEAIQSISILQRNVHFTVRHDGKLVLDLPAASSLRERLARLWGHAELEKFVDVEDVQGTIHISGLVERPADAGISSRKVMLVINGRIIRDSGIVRAAESAYRTTVAHGVRPSLVLVIRLSGPDVDVNVHPAKAEVRLRDRWTVERAVEEAVRRALGVFDASAGLGWRPRSFANAQGQQPQMYGGEPFVFGGRTGVGGLFAPLDNSDGFAAGSEANGNTEITNESLEAIEALNEAESLVVPPLVQLRRTFMMFEHEDGIVLIDQHSAHERILYEAFMQTINSGEAPGQRLLFPLTLHLSAAEADAFEGGKEIFEQLGFEIQEFGGKSLIVSSVPMPHPRFDAEKCLRETLAQLAGDRQAGIHATHERLAATIACKAAVKAGDQLSIDEMRSLYRSLAATRLPAHDIHGRATIVRLGWDGIERQFGRR